MPVGPTGKNGVILRPLYTTPLTDGTDAFVYNGSVIPNVDLKAASNQGAQGDSGYSQSLDLVVSGAATVLQISSYIGGAGSDPGDDGEYIGATGHEALVGNAVDIRGAAGAGTHDILGPNSSVDGGVVLFDGGTGTSIKDSGILGTTIAASIDKTDNITITGALDLNALVTSVAANTAKVTNATHTGDITGATALTIGAKKVLAQHLETMATITPGAYASANIDVNQQGQVTLVNEGATVNNPPGTCLWYGAASAPSGWLNCDGSAVSRATYSDLFTAIGTTFGVGDGSTTFNLPDLTGRIIAGYGTGSRLAQEQTFAGTQGTETHTLTRGQMAAHDHSVTELPVADAGVEVGAFGTIAVDRDINSTNTDSAGSGSAHNNVQPTIILNVIIKT